MIPNYARSPMRDRLVGQRRYRRRPHFSVPRRPGGRRLSRRRLGLVIAFGLAIVANLVVVLAHRGALPFYGQQGSAQSTGARALFAAVPTPPAPATPREPNAADAEQPERNSAAPAAVAETSLSAGAEAAVPATTAVSATTALAPVLTAAAPIPGAVESAIENLQVGSPALETPAPAPVEQTQPAIELQPPIEQPLPAADRAVMAALALRDLVDALPVDLRAGTALAASGRVLKAALQPNQTFAGALQAQGLAEADVNGAIAALSGLLDFRRVRAGDNLAVHLDPAGGLDRVELRSRAGSGPGAVFVAYRDGEGLKGEQRPIEVETRRALVSGEVHSTLYESMLATGEGTQLIRDFTDVFGWEIDFYREVQEGDRFRALVEKRFADGRFIGYGRMLAAEYRGRGEAHRAFYFNQGETVGYFNDSGESMQKSFLKSPVEVTRITSHFGMRFHPIKKRHRKHNGVDYGAPKGTQVWTVADGVVTTRTYNSGIGNYVKVRHANGYETVYGHLNGFADLKVGSKVRQRPTADHTAFAAQLRALTRELDAVEIALAQERLAGQG